MDTEQLVELGNRIALLASIGVAIVWVTYAFFFRWSKTRAGRSVFVFLSALTLIFILNATSLWLGRTWGPPEFHIREWFRIVVYLYGLGAVLWLGYALVTNWRRTGMVLNLEARARKARAELGEPTTKETPVQ